MNPIYISAKEHLGEHLTLNPNVPPYKGCAEAVSFILKAAGYEVPYGGLQGVNVLIEWMLNNGFQEVKQPYAGCVITAHNPDPTVTDWAHCGVILRFGIASNNSFTNAQGQVGRFTENYSIASWEQFFDDIHGSITRYFALV